MKNKRLTGTVLILLCLCLFTTTCFAYTKRDTKPDTWVGGSSFADCYMPTYEEVGGPKEDRTVGMYYFIWHSSFMFQLLYPTLPHNFNLHKVELGLQELGEPGWIHYWDEPFFGYYRDEDPFVIRKHAQMLTDAGVDVIIFDNTNSFVYANVIQDIMDVYTQMREEGNDTPMICSAMHNVSDLIAPNDLYGHFFADTVSDKVKSQIDDLWFRWNGKYLLLADRDQTLGNPESPEIYKTAFEIRTCWINGGEYCWPYITANWDEYGYVGDPSKVEAIVVATADTSAGGDYHKSSHYNRTSSGDPRQGTCFKERWERALSKEPRMVLVTQFNEWVAQYLPNCRPGAKGLMAHFVDVWDWDNNRDIEPMREHSDEYGYGDNYMLFLNYYVRKYKGVRQIPTYKAQTTIDTGGSFSQWNNVTSSYLDDLGDTLHRDYQAVFSDPFREEDEYYYYHEGENTWHYRNNTGRNDFDTLKVTHDDDFVYFYAKTREPLTAPSDGDCYMNLWLNTNASYQDGFEGYDYMVGRHIDTKNGYMSVEHTDGGWNWQTVGEVPFTVDDDQLMLAIPRAWLGYTQKTAQTVSLDFKWLDHVTMTEDGIDLMDLIDKGDTAPNDRYNYRYQAVFSPWNDQAVFLPEKTVTVFDKEDLTAFVLSSLPETVKGARTVTFDSTPRFGAMDKKGLYIPKLSDEGYKDKLTYRVKDKNKTLLAMGTVSVCHGSSLRYLTDVALYDTDKSKEGTQSAVLSISVMQTFWQAWRTAPKTGRGIIACFDDQNRLLCAVPHTPNEESTTPLFDITIPKNSEPNIVRIRLLQTTAQ